MKRLLTLLLVVLPACSESAIDDLVAKPAPPPVYDSVAARIEALSGRDALDYADPDHWGCSPSAGDVCDETRTLAEVVTDGTETTVTWEPAAGPELDCFYIYPTVDTQLKTENHDRIDDVAAARNVIRLQAAPFSAVCRVIAPFYRQAKLGTYIDAPEKSVPVFLNAFADVSAAFEYYLANWNEGRPVVIMGHSQGGQMSNYLLHSYFDGVTPVTKIPGSESSDKLRARLVAALPIGFNVFVPAGEKAGGSFSDLPVCKAIDEAGCVLTYRSFPERHVFSTVGSSVYAVDDTLVEYGLLNRGVEDGDEQVCVNPAVGPSLAPAAVTDASGEAVKFGDIRLLLGTWNPLSTPEELYPGRYAATCRNDIIGGNFLALGRHEEPGVPDQRGDPLFVSSAAADNAIGLHIGDYHLALGDLVEQVRRKASAFSAR